MDRFIPNQSGDSNFLHDMVGEAASAVQQVAGDVADEVHSPGLVASHSGFISPILSDAVSAAHGLATELQHAATHVASEAILAQISPGVAGGVSPQVQHSGLLGTASGFIKQVSSDAVSAAHGVATEVQHAGKVGESLTSIDPLVPSIIKEVSSEVISAVQNVPGVATEVGNSGLLDTASGFLKQVSSDAISAAQGVASEIEHVGAVSESLAKIDNLVPSVIKQVSSEALSATQKVAGVAAGLASDVQHGGILNNATGLIKDVSSQAILAAQGVVAELQHGGAVKEETKKLEYLAFVYVAIVRLVLLFSRLYTNLKQKSGLLKPALGMVEKIVKIVLRSIFDKFFDALYEKLKFVDDKVGELVTKIDSLLPSVVKQVLSKVISAARYALGPTVVRSTVVPSTDVASQLLQSGLIPEELQMLAYLKYFKYFVLVQAAALRLFKLYFLVKKVSGPLKPVIDTIERAVISVYQKFFAEMVKRLVKWVLIKFFGVPAEIFHIIDKVGNLNKIAELSKLGNFSKFNALGKVEDVSRLGDLSNLGDMSNVGDLSKFGSLSKIDALIPSEMKMVSSGSTSAAQNPPGVAGSAKELPGAGVLSTASGFFKQAPSYAITGYQVMADVQHAESVEAVTKIDSLVSPLFKQVSLSLATSVAQKATGVTSGGATEVHRTRLVSSPTGLVKQISSRDGSAVAKARRVAQGLATAGVGSTAYGFITQPPSEPIVVTQRSPEVQHPIEVPVLAKSILDIVKPKVEKYAVSVWHKLNRIPFFPQVAWLVVLIASFFAEKYNGTVAAGAEKGYKVPSILPLVPTEKIAKVFSEGKSD
ncbi:hypothetical protein V6N13_087836 [Hibiscus sabdariffa]|uniref:Uncharacterized protein n=1 Tax=Hibiscus sabdariffa TaxID=183260 RepID=A0ABR2FY24_9ROSI